MIKNKLLGYATIAANCMLLQTTAFAKSDFVTLHPALAVYIYAPVKQLTQITEFEKLLKEVIAAYEKDFTSINQGVLEKKAGDRYKTLRYKTGFRLPDFPQAYLELDNPKKNKSYIAYTADTENKAVATALFNKLKQQLDTIDFGSLDLVEDEEAKLPVGAIKLASYKTLGLDPDMSEKMSELQIDIILEEELQVDIAKPNQPMGFRYKVKLSVGQQ